MRLLHNFFAVSSEISTDMLITFNIEQEVKKLFEAVFTREIGDDAERGRRDRDPPRLQTIFYETPKINYNLYTYSPQKQSIEHMAMSQIKGKRTGLQPVEPTNCSAQRLFYYGCFGKIIYRHEG